MSGPTNPMRRWRRAVAAALLAPLVLHAEPAPPPSALDGPLFYQLLLGELDLRDGNAGNAYARFLDVAQRTRDEALFRRTVEVALQARAGDQALAAARAWRVALPNSLEALRYEVQILAAMNRGKDMAEPLKLLLTRTPDNERGQLIAGLPRLVARASDKRAQAQGLDELLKPYADAPATRTAVKVAIARAWWQAGDGARAMQGIERAHADEPQAPGPLLLALEMAPTVPEAEKLVADRLSQPGVDTGLRLAYARMLAASQRYVDAQAQLKAATREKPDLAGAWLSLGALQLELRQPREAQASLQRFLQVRSTTPPAPVARSDDDDEDENSGSADADGGRTQAWLMLAQAAEMQGDLKGAGAWLDRIDDPQRALEVQSRRATLLARQGKVQEARAMVQQVPERRPEDARAKMLAESQVLRDVKRWADAHAVLVQANERFPGDTDLLYEQAMMAEKLQRMDEMERLLKRVIELKPDHQHAYNALGYSLAERNVRLPEARTLVNRALELAPGDPFITDSAGWVEFRLGNRAQALVHLRRAYAARPDTEIGAHLGEVLWVDGQRDEARRIWRESRDRDAENEVLRETLARLQVRL